MALKVREANPDKPTRIVIYGEEGTGKSSFGASAPNPIFISAEGGIDHIPGAKDLGDVATWDEFIGQINSLITESHDFKTLVIDSADWVERLCHAKVVKDGGGVNRSIVTAGSGYGHGYREAEKLHREAIELLNTLRESKKMNIIVTGHYQVKPVKDPDAAHDYDGFGIKCHDMVSGLWREWADAVLFVRFKTHTKAGEDKTLALGTGERVIFTEKRPAYYAKNRYDMPAEMPFTKNFWDDIKPYLKKNNAAEMKLLQTECAELLAKVTDVETKKKATEYVEKNKADIAGLMKAKKHLQKTVNVNA